MNYSRVVCVNSHAHQDRKSETRISPFMSKAVLTEPVTDNQVYRARGHRPAGDFERRDSIPWIRYADHCGDQSKPAEGRGRQTVPGGIFYRLHIVPVHLPPLREMLLPKELTANHLRDDSPSWLFDFPIPSTGIILKEALDQFTQHLLQKAMRMKDGNISHVGKLLGIPGGNLRYKLEKNQKGQ